METDYSDPDSLSDEGEYLEKLLADLKQQPKSLDVSSYTGSEEEYMAESEDEGDFEEEGDDINGSRICLSLDISGGSFMEEDSSFEHVNLDFGRNNSGTLYQMEAPGDDFVFIARDKEEVRAKYSANSSQLRGEFIPRTIKAASSPEEVLGMDEGGYAMDEDGDEAGDFSPWEISDHVKGGSDSEGSQRDGLALRSQKQHESSIKNGTKKKSTRKFKYSCAGFPNPWSKTPHVYPGWITAA